LVLVIAGLGNYLSHSQKNKFYRSNHNNNHINSIFITEKQVVNCLGDDAKDIKHFIHAVL
jgi:hypothetical protein